MSGAFINARLGRDLANDVARISKNNTGNRYAYCDLTGDNTYTDYGLRILRGNLGQNTDTNIYHRGTGELRVEAPNTAQLSFHTNSVERVRVYPSGVFHLSPNSASPTQPAFCATYSGSVAVASASNYIVFDTAIFNHGSYYNATTGLFTAPVTGYYFFRFHLLPNNPTTSATEISIVRNGANFAGSRSVVQHPANTWNTLYCNVIFYLLANDTVGVYVNTLPAALHNDSTYTSFSGYLLG